jgi:rifampicin phosphotransferase
VRLNRIIFTSDSVFGKAPRQRLLILVIGMAALTWMTAYLGAGAGLYVLTSGVLIVLQRLLVTMEKGAIRRFWSNLWNKPVVTPGILTLRQPAALAGCGNKACRLALMKAEGVPVPDGVVLNATFLARYGAAPKEARATLLADVWKHLDAGEVAVRSSAAGEDGAEHSFAGVFESLLHVEPTSLPSAVDDVLASFNCDRAGAYGVSAAGANILIQTMVDAEYAGVCFTRAPTSSGQMMIEMVRGTADEFVSGAATPETFQYGRVTGLPEEGRTPPIDVKPLLAIARKAETLFGGPQDIEWTWRNGEFAIVQSRDITTSAIGDKDAVMIEDHRAHLLARVAGMSAGEPALVRSELAELLPRPTPLSLSLMEAIWAAGGSVDLACRALGMEYNVAEDAPSYLVPVFGRLYIDHQQQTIRAPAVNRLLFRRLVKAADTVESDLRNGLFAELDAESATLEAVDFNRMETADLFRAAERLRKRFVTETYAEVEMVNILASLFVDRAHEGLGKTNIDPSAVLSIAGGTHVAKALAEASAMTGAGRSAALLRAMGHRAAFDYELSNPRYSETPAELDRILSGQTAPQPEMPIPAGLSKKLTQLVQLARRFQILKEDAKHMALNELAVLRRIVLAIDERHSLDGLAFCMTFEELQAFGDNTSPTILETARQRRAEALAFADLPGLPSSLSPAQIELASQKDDGIAAFGEGVLAGKRVAGTRPVVGRARVIGVREAEAGTPVTGIQHGTIIVAPMIPHAWLPHFRELSGLVCDIGGFLSHTAIIAREFDLAMTVGVTQWKTIPDGSMIRIEADGSVSILERAELSAISLEVAE